MKVELTDTQAENFAQALRKMLRDAIKRSQAVKGDINRRGHEAYAAELSEVIRALEGDDIEPGSVQS